jgi:hypothetical protein
MERAIIDRSPTLLATSVPDRRRPASSPTIPPSLLAITTHPIAGRSAELHVIGARWREVCDGGRRVVVAHGEPGIGKTRLVGQAALTAHHDGSLVLFGRCDRDALTPYQPIVDALRPFLRAVPPAAHAKARTGNSSNWRVCCPTSLTRSDVSPGRSSTNPAHATACSRP